jgi:hypothetical protein
MNPIQTPAETPMDIALFGHWSYAFCVSLYGLLMVVLMWYFRVTFRFAVWRFFFTITFYALLVLGLGFEWMADLFGVWQFDKARHLFDIKVPIFGWITGHRVPIEEILWITLVVPLFYYLYLWSTLLFHDIIYVIDEKGKFYKREERWVGFLETTRITTRLKGRRGQENETVIKIRKPGFIARWIKRTFYERPPQ